MRKENMRIRTHPGEVLREEFLTPLGITAHALSLEIKVPASRISEIVKEKRSVTADTALRLAKFFGTSPDFWLNLQKNYDISVAMQTKAKEVEHIIPFNFAHSV